MTTHQTTRCMTVFRVGEVVSVEFPFTDMQGRKRRPGVVLASDAKDLLLARITTHEPRHPFDVPLQDWAAIGLPKPSTARHACRILGGSPARRPPLTSPPGDYDLMLRGVIIQRTVGGCQRPAGTSLSRRGKLTDRRTIKPRGPSAPLPDRLADRGAGGPRRSGQDRLDDGAVHVGEPEVAAARSNWPRCVAASERFRFLGREHRKRQRPGSLRSEGPAGGGRHPASSVRGITTPVRPPLCPWSLHSPDFPRGPASGRMPARHHAAATSVAAPRRLRSTRSSPRTSRAGLSGVTRRSVPCRATSIRNSAAISSAASSASHFGRALCTGCGQGFVIAFSCKGRGVCPSCNGRHMAQTAAHLVDHVIPPVPVRQWVISVPKRLRGFLADRPAAVAALTRIFIEEIERLLGAAAGVTSDACAPAASCRASLSRCRLADSPASQACPDVPFTHASRSCTTVPLTSVSR
jgi:hypothetical protein